MWDQMKTTLLPDGLCLPLWQLQTKTVKNKKCSMKFSQNNKEKEHKT
jgi:hypothetical protein